MSFTIRLAGPGRDASDEPARSIHTALCARGVPSRLIEEKAVAAWTSAAHDFHRQCPWGPGSRLDVITSRLNKRNVACVVHCTGMARKEDQGRAEVFVEGSGVLLASTYGADDPCGRVIRLLEELELIPAAPGGREGDKSPGMLEPRAFCTPENLGPSREKRVISRLFADG